KLPPQVLDAAVDRQGDLGRYRPSTAFRRKREIPPTGIRDQRLTWNCPLPRAVQQEVDAQKTS
ncbi:MAG TPA: hypothetical protein VGM83_20710, partial [Devosiaceae bacterium]